MKLSLAGKMFAAMFGIATVMVALVLLWAGWALTGGFSLYVSTAALAGMDGVADALEHDYAAHGNWSGVAGHPAVWDAALRAQGPFSLHPGGHGGPPHDDDDGDFRPPPDGLAGPPSGDAGPPPPWPHNGPPGPAPEGLVGHLRHRLALLDAAHNTVAGQPERLPFAAHRAVMVNGAVVGDLLFDVGPLPGGLEKSFLAARFRDLYIAGGVAMLLSGLAAVLLSRHILAPIGQVTAGARRLASGDFAARINTGRRDELGQLVTDFNALAQSLESSEQSRRRWVADTSHELRTPLAVLRAQIEALQDGVQPVNERALANLHGEVLRMAALVGDLHELSRADAGGLALRPERVAPVALMEDVLASFAARREARGLTLECDELAACGATVRADPDRLRQVFANIVENSIRYTDEGGVIRVTQRLERGSVVVCVEDSAPAVPEAKMPRIFDRFFRAETSRSRDTGGSGLGLAICKAIIDAHGGTIAAAGSPLGGLAVTIRLPVADAGA